ncbi:MAG: amino acid ABC transporter permease [Beijerinckiaceae bacterium]|nr:amino acid ABC transporter permease [Beijerinckiaceae bacterium]
MNLALTDLTDNGLLFFKGALWTVGLSAAAIFTGLLLGVFGAAGRRSQIAPLRWFAGAYVELIRNTPFIVQLFFIYFGLPRLGLKMGSVEAAFLAMSLNLGGYATEIIRAGLDSISKGAWEAGYSLGLTRFQTFRLVVLVPALQKVYPALTSQFIIILLGSSVVSQIAVEELTYVGSYIQSRNFRAFETTLVVAAIYLLLALGFQQMFAAVGRRVFAYAEHRR